MGQVDSPLYPLYPYIYYISFRIKHLAVISALYALLYAQTKKNPAEAGSKIETNDYSNSLMKALTAS